MKIRLMLDDTDELLRNNELNVRLVARDGDAYPPYSLVEVDGNVDDLRIRRPNGSILKPKSHITIYDYIMVVEWDISMLK